MYYHIAATVNVADLVRERVHFVIRLNVGSQPPVFLDARGKPIDLAVAQGETVRVLNVRYREGGKGPRARVRPH